MIIYLPTRGIIYPGVGAKRLYRQGLIHSLVGASGGGAWWEGLVGSVGGLILYNITMGIIPGDNHQLLFPSCYMSHVYLHMYRVVIPGLIVSLCNAGSMLISTNFTGQIQYSEWYVDFHILLPKSVYKTLLSIYSLCLFRVRYYHDNGR